MPEQESLPPWADLPPVSPLRADPGPAGDGTRTRRMTHRVRRAAGPSGGPSAARPGGGAAG